MIVYFSYPYSDAPIKRTLEVLDKIVKLLKKRRDINPIVPHFIDLLHGFPKGYESSKLLEDEIHLITISDALCHFEEYSAGVLWEIAIARFFKIPVVTYKELLEGWEKDE